MRIRNLTSKTIYLPSRDISISPNGEYILPIEILNTFIASYDGLCELDFSNTSNIVVKQLGNMCATMGTDGVLNITVMRDATLEESKSVHDYVESISEPTGITFDNITETNPQIVNVLGTDYKIIMGDVNEYPRLEHLSGYCDLSNKLVVIGEPLNCDTPESKKFMKNQTIRHELIHAYLYESGLDTESWGCNEEIVDWIAIQSPKIFELFTEIKVL